MTQPTDDLAAQMVREKNLISTIISMYHTTRLTDTPFADHIHGKAIVREAFAEYRAAALTAQAEEIERLRATGKALVEAIERAAPRLMDMEAVYQSHGFPPPLPEHRFADQFEAFRAALKAAQEVKA